MEKVMCYNCGEETPNVLSRCVHCGQPIAKYPTDNYGGPQPFPPAYSNHAPAQDAATKKQRNGFVSFYLWLNFIGACVDTARSLLSFALMLLNPRDVTVEMYSAKILNDGMILLFAIPIIAGFWLLIRWKKLGYWILTVTLIFAQCLWFALYSDVMVLVFLPGLSLLILFLILQIKKNGKSCWSQLS